MTKQLIRKDLGVCDYLPTYLRMQQFSAQRPPDQIDELWLLQHPPVFTLGRNSKPEHLLAPGDIPVVPIDRGGQVTYHGPGQLVGYILLDVKRNGFGVRQLVTALEQSIVALLADYQIDSHAKPDAPGVYVGERKIAALGLRIKGGKSYHGLSLNLDMDTEPFSRINPCGYAGLQIAQMREFLDPIDEQQIKSRLTAHLARILGYDEVIDGH
ncbi:MAG: lipoyl(octanoyl) transferase LipB [Gammaproteobacteria bacterium]|nr:lipoyl(octanoyl) transferase LipB [Gammaproteobacteria bacterium]